MSDTASNPPGRQAVRRWVRRLLTWSLPSVALVPGVFVVWFYLLGPQPPVVALPDDDPGAALDIAEARSAVKMWPFRASKWGRLGMVLRVYGFKPEAITCIAGCPVEPLEPAMALSPGSLPGGIESRRGFGTSQAVGAARRFRPDAAAGSCRDAAASGRHGRGGGTFPVRAPHRSRECPGAARHGPRGPQSW